MRTGDTVYHVSRKRKARSEGEEPAGHTWVCPLLVQTPRLGSFHSPARSPLLLAWPAVLATADHALQFRGVWGTEAAPQEANAVGTSLLERRTGQQPFHYKA